MNRPLGGFEVVQHDPYGNRVVSCSGSRLSCDCAPDRSKTDFVR